MYKQFYQLFLEVNKDKQHYAAHSHHYWPDVTRQATIDYWDDSAKMVDAKWNYFFEKKIPRCQQLIANILNLSHPQQIVFASSTHEFVYRLISCFDSSKPIRVLTTDSEFFSFDRQINRLAEDNKVIIDKVAVDPISNFENAFIEKIKTNSYDFIFFSHVFFNSGYVVKDLKKIVAAVSNPNTIIAIDGYHGFMALPTDLQSIEARVFYLAGSYKYAQGGEGCCFMTVPQECTLRPVYTGWFGGFNELSQGNRTVNYADNGLRFAGSTMDFTPIYRLIAVLELFESQNITVNKIHKHIQTLQNNFLEALHTLNHPQLNQNNILLHDLNLHGHFFTFELKFSAAAKEMHEFLLSKNIVTDYRGSRLRFGFGLYQNDRIDFNLVK